MYGTTDVIAVYSILRMILPPQLVFLNIAVHTEIQNQVVIAVNAVYALSVSSILLLLQQPYTSSASVFTAFCCWRWHTILLLLLMLHLLHVRDACVALRSFLWLRFRHLAAVERPLQKMTLGNIGLAHTSVTEGFYLVRLTEQDPPDHTPSETQTASFPSEATSLKLPRRRNSVS